MRSLLRALPLALLAGCVCGAETCPLTPTLHVTAAPFALTDASTTDRDGAAHCVEHAAEGDPLYVTWVLPEDVPDPADSALVTVETPCGTQTESAAFMDGLARAALVAPDGAGWGVTVSVSAQNAADSCAISPVDTDTDDGDTAAPTLDCEDEVEDTDDTDPGTTDP